MNTEEKIYRINELNDSIHKLDYFINTVDPEMNIQRGSGSFDINAIIKIKMVKSFSIFASRYYGCGTRNQEIPVPNELIEELNILVRKRRDTLNAELKDLLK